MTADTIDHRFQATPDQAAAIERDGFLVVAGPTTKPCPDHREYGGVIFCEACVEQMGCFVPVPTTKPCPECGGKGTARYPIDNFASVKCNECNGDGTVPIAVEVVVPERECTTERCTNPRRCTYEPARTLLRGTAEAVPVEKCSGYTLHICEEVGIWLLHSPLDKPFNDDGLTEVDVTHHFADVPRPEVGDTAWIIRGEG